MGVNASLPIFTGGRLSAGQREVELNAKAAEDSLKEYEDLIFKNVHNAWIQTRTGYRAIAAARDYVKASSEALELSQERYTAGTLSIAEVSQAEVSFLQAQISLVGANYDYLKCLSVLSFESGEISKRISNHLNSPNRHE